MHCLWNFDVHIGDLAYNADSDSVNLNRAQDSEFLTSSPQNADVDGSGVENAIQTVT